jgi:hypothetical protein
MSTERNFKVALQDNPLADLVSASETPKDLSDCFSFETLTSPVEFWAPVPSETVPEDNDFATPQVKTALPPLEPTKTISKSYKQNFTFKRPQFMKSKFPVSTKFPIQVTFEFQEDNE